MTISKVCSHLQYINIALVLLNRILCIHLELAHNVTIYIEQKVSSININIHRSLNEPISSAAIGGDSLSP